MQGQQKKSSDPKEVSQQDNFSVAPPNISLPKGGGAIQGMGEKFAANPVTGTGSTTVPIFTSSGRAEFSPQLALSYDSGSGNGIFGLGWNLSLPSITRKTDKGLPRYLDHNNSDTFLLSGSEDLVPTSKSTQTINNESYVVHYYRPRIEGLFSRIERWTKNSDGDVHWRSLSKDNILTIYGKDSNSRITNPEKPQQIFSWLICETRDDKGNAIIYQYKEEDGKKIELSQIHQKNRGDKDSNKRTANRYLNHIFYGNKISLLDANNQRPFFLSDDQLSKENWFFEVVFDYGEHDKTQPTSNEISSWEHRQDAFSSYRSGFEIRTSRLCQRVLMFHHFPDVAEIGNDYLVRSSNFNYNKNDKNFTFLESTHEVGYKKQADDSYLSRQLPPLEFTYTQAEISKQLHTIEKNSIQNLPMGIDGATYRWVDLDGEGLSGILTEQADGWFYKRNHSPTTTFRDNNDKPQTQARFAPLEQVAKKPSFALASGGQFMDLAGNGQLDLVNFDSPTAGYFERTKNEDWELFKTFDSLPQLNWKNPNLKMIDITGDGHADILISEDEIFCWYPSLAEQGFAPSKKVRKALDEETGPRIVFADSYALADSWFSSAENMRYIHHTLEKYFILALKRNRLVALTKEDKAKGRFTRIDNITWSETPVQGWVKGLAFPVLFHRQTFTNKDGSTGTLYLISNDINTNKETLEAIYQKRWKVEVFHKSIKSNTSMAKSPARTIRTQSNHIFMSLYATAN